jgi:N-acetylglucosaminyldiphosphoundecaprenol N-acetyl-beta-D-mannosaminyltransferase
MGMPIDPVTEPQAVAHVIGSLAAGRGGWVITPNLDQLRLYRQDRRLRSMYDRADLVLADGMPLLWASRVQGTPLPARVAGSEIIFALTEAAARAGRSIFLLGGNEGTAADAAGRLAADYPGLRVAGTCCPPFGFQKSPAEMKRIERELAAARPDIVYVGLGFPKQERLIEAVRHAAPNAWFLGIGVTFSFVSGEIVRAPVWMRRVGLEWVHRMCQEPERLLERYLLRDMPYAVGLFASAAGRRLGWGVDLRRIGRPEGSAGDR